ncbi:MAG: hypothetical protein AAGA60_10720 [Cyanobacteria bacterium P01_E01_bin.42]
MAFFDTIDRACWSVLALSASSAACLAGMDLYVDRYRDRRAVFASGWMDDAAPIFVAV